MNNLNLLKNNLSFNNVNNYIIIIFFYLSSLIQSFINSNDPLTNKTMLGKKRNLENIRQTTSSKNNLELYHSTSYSDSNKINNSTGTKITKELSNLYNMERSICISCVKKKNIKYPTNKIIPCFPFFASS